MNFFSKIKQYYRYKRNCKKLEKRQSKVDPKEVERQLNFYSQFIRQGDLCFDIGANVGDKSEIFLKLGAKVVAVEPQESCWRVLKKRFKGEQVSVEDCVLSDKEGKITLFIDRSTTLSTIDGEWIGAVRGSGRFASHNWNTTVEVRSTTLDNLIKKYKKPKYCKIDVEGAELRVLSGLSEPVEFISFEFVTERKKATSGCLEYLNKLGDARFNYYIGDSGEFFLEDWVDINSMSDIIGRMDNDINNFGEIYVNYAR